MWAVNVWLAIMMILVLIVTGVWTLIALADFFGHELHDTPDDQQRLDVLDRNNGKTPGRLGE